MKNKKIFLTILVILILNILLGMYSYIYAATDTTYISLSNDGIKVNGESISNNTEGAVYLTSSTNNGGTSSSATSANIEIKNVINITKAGTYEFTGTLTDGQISVNSNNISGDVIIVLNNASITCENAPVIMAYNKSITDTKCNLIIKTVNGTTNTLTGGKIKQSVQGWEDQSSILYYIEKDNDDEGNYYERYKYDGAISSDIAITFEGEGKLIVNSTAKEGIECKQNITINSGSYEINSKDDGINACTDNTSITINGGTVLVNVQKDAEEGDGIDSNGTIYINGGNVYSFAAETSGDNGLDSDNEIYINGGNVVATGNMADAINSDSKQSYLQLNFNDKVTADTLITILDSNENAQVAFKSDRSYQILTISTSNLDTNNFKVYESGDIVGENENGLYTKITSYTKGTEKSYSNTSSGRMQRQFGEKGDRDIKSESDFKVFYIVLAVLGGLLIIVIIITIITNKKEMKS